MQDPAPWMRGVHNAILSLGSRSPHLGWEGKGELTAKRHWQRLKADRVTRLKTSFLSAPLRLKLLHVGSSPLPSIHSLKVHRVYFHWAMISDAPERPAAIWTTRSQQTGHGAKELIRLGWQPQTRQRDFCSHPGKPCRRDSDGAPLKVKRRKHVHRSQGIPGERRLLASLTHCW